MAHVRKDSKKPTTTISWDEDILLAVEQYWRTNNKKDRGTGVNELCKLGLKYIALVEKKKQRERMMG